MNLTMLTNYPSSATEKCPTEGRVKRLWLALFLCLAALFANEAYAETPLSALMRSMKSDAAVRMAYQETRTLELMDKPWKGSGYLYSLPPDLMIKEQVQPERVLMAIKGDKMFYFEPANKVRHQVEIAEDNPLSLNVGVFKSLINADEALLHRLYQVEFHARTKDWAMILTPKQDTRSGFSILISGLAQQQADTLKVKQADGDFSEFTMQKDAAGAEVKTAADRLYRELLGE
ncbi:MAG: outer membrane lipoprotein carrier protein LolA [Methylovulum sp.]|nr:outer membrane lipoprotein carrier protein LolA [Methylovulum sp.]